MAPPPQPKKSRTGLYIVLGIVVVVLLVCGGAAYAISRAVNNVANAVTTAVATITPPTTSGTDITGVQIGKGDDQGNITTKTNTFTQSDTIVIDYTATATNTTSQVTLKILDSTGTELTGGPGPQTLENGKHDYFFAVTITGADSYTAELDFNGTAEASVSFTVS
jgi:hypothetical protein